MRSMEWGSLLLIVLIQIVVLVVLVGTRRLSSNDAWRQFSFDFSHKTAVVIGHGNVSLDIARILVKTPKDFSPKILCITSMRDDATKGRFSGATHASGLYL